jgi:hypothetical protein
MNSSSIIIQLLSNGKNATTVFSDLESALYALGYYFPIEIFNLSIFMVVSVMGIIGNIFCMIIFFRPAFYSPTSPAIYSYLRYEAMIGLVGNLFAAISGLINCPDIVQFLNNYTSQWINSFIAIPMNNMTYYAKFLIEIVIVVDRIMMLVPSLGSQIGLNSLLKNKRPYLVLLGVCIFTVLIDYPYIYLWISPSATVLVNYGEPGYQVFTYYGYIKGSWANWGTYGYSIMLFIYIFKNLVTFVFETLLNVTSLVLFKHRLAHKAKLVITKTAKSRPIHVNLVETSLSLSAANNAHKHGESSGSESAGGRNMANLVMVMSLSGFIHNMVLLSFTLYNLINPKPNLAVKTLQFSAAFASTVRHAINFVQFYFFNTIFRKEAKLVLAKIKV